MTFCVYSAVDSGSVTRFFAVAQPAASDSPVMYVTLIALGGSAPPVVTLTFASSPSTAITYNQGRTTVVSGSAAIDVAYGPVPTAPPGAIGTLFQLQFFLDAGTTIDMLNGTAWSMLLTGTPGQSFAWVVADGVADALHAVALPFFLARQATVNGPLGVSGPATFAALSAQSATISGSLTTAGPATFAALSAQSAAIGGSFTTAGPATFAALSAQNAAIGGSFTAAGPATFAALSAQSATISGSFTTTGNVGIKAGGLTVGDSSPPPTGQIKSTSDVSVGGSLTVAGGAHVAGGVVANGLNVGTNGAQTQYTWPYESIGTDNPAHNLRLLSHGAVLTHSPRGFWVSKDQGGSGTLVVDGDASVGGNLTITGEPSISGQHLTFNANWAVIQSAGRLHITGGETLFLLNKNGVIVGKEWSGTGDLTVEGTLSCPNKHFRIDHPLDPERMDLVHGCIEGPENGVYYRGQGRLVDGRAVIELPAYFERLTRRDGRTVQLTVHSDGDEPVAPLVASSVSDGRFTVRIADGRKLSQRFYWEVKAVRADVPELRTEWPKRTPA